MQSRLQSASNNINLKLISGTNAAVNASEVRKMSLILSRIHIKRNTYSLIAVTDRSLFHFDPTELYLCNILWLCH